MNDRLSLREDTFAAGIARIEADIAAAGDAPVMRVSHACLVTVCAAKA